MKPNKPFKLNPSMAALKPSKFVHYKGVEEFRGLSTYDKPMNAANGSEFIEMDTGKKFMFDAPTATWYEQPSSGGSGGGGSVEPLMVNVVVENGLTQLDKTSSTIYNAYIAGTPLIFNDGDAKGVIHPSLFMVESLDEYSFTLAYFDSTATYHIFRGPGNSNPTTGDIGT